MRQPISRSSDAGASLPSFCVSRSPSGGLTFTPSGPRLSLALFSCANSSRSTAPRLDNQPNAVPLLIVRWSSRKSHATISLAPLQRTVLSLVSRMASSSGRSIFPPGHQVTATFQGTSAREVDARSAKYPATANAKPATIYEEGIGRTCDDSP